MMDLMNISQKNKEELRYFIESTKAFEYYKKPIQLAYGKPSHFYFDFRRLTGDPKGINTTASILYTLIEKIGNVKSVGGMESGAIPLATAISLLSLTRSPGNSIRSFYVRKERKKHGLTNIIEGCITSPAVVVDDVITTGESAVKAIKTIRDEGHEVKHLITIVFRGTEEDRKRIESENKIKFYYIFEGKEFTSKFEKEHPEVLTYK
jgi:orotate phosphoribosyltransferase